MLELMAISAFLMDKIISYVLLILEITKKNANRFKNYSVAKT